MADFRPAYGVLDEVAEGIVLFEGEQVRFVNVAAARMLAVDREKAIGRPVIWVLRDHRLEALTLRGTGAVEIETRGRRLLARAISCGVVLRDMTELRRAQEDARELLAVLSHELRTPATAIRAALEALELQPTEPLRSRFVARALTEAERLGRLLEDLTVDSRPPRSRSLEIADIAQRAVGVLQATLSRRGVRLEFELPHLQVWADEDKFLQVLVNLLENAAVHGPEGGQVCLVAWTDGAMVRLEVRDEGTPVDRKRVEALFLPHSRGGGVKVNGTGLGLYIVRSIAARWGGEAWGGPRADGIGNAFGASVPGARHGMAPDVG